MKIENPNPPGIRPRQSEPLDRADAVRQQGGTATGGSTASRSTDRLALSADVKLAQAAVETAAALPDIRHELVEKVRALDARGELGRDAVRLAEAMIERWLTTP